MKSRRVSIVLLLTIKAAFLLPVVMFGQGVIITEKDIAEPHESAVFEIRSDDKGILIPRLTTDQRTGILFPANGLLVFDITENQFFYYDAGIKDGKGGWVEAVGPPGPPGTTSWIDHTEYVYTGKRVAIGNESVPSGSFEISPVEGSEDLDPLFEVKNEQGYPVFSIYRDRVEVILDDSPGNRGRGGFAVSGRTGTKQEVRELFVVSPDETRVYLDDSGAKGRGGFAVSGRTGTKEGGSDFLSVYPGMTRVFVDNNAAKGRGGFAVSGRTGTKGEETEFFNVYSGEGADIMNPSEARVLWYPLKNAFMTGQVLIESPDSVGDNSMATGFESKAAGNYSQALGYKAIARGDYSTAIGREAVADNENSFAFGQFAQAKNEESYAFGRGAIAEGLRSFAFGSEGIDSAGVLTGAAYAKGDYSFAIGQGSISEGFGSFAIGLADTASGDYSVAMGYKSSAKKFGAIAIGIRTIADGKKSVAMGESTYASGHGATAMGWLTKSRGQDATAMGHWTIADGVGSTAMCIHTHAIGNGATAMGYATSAHSWASLVIGQFNDTTYTSSEYWVLEDPVFVIGNGINNANRSNAMTVLKNGNVGIATISPLEKLHVDGNALVDTNLYVGNDIVVGRKMLLDNSIDNQNYLQGQYEPAVYSSKSGGYFEGSASLVLQAGSTLNNRHIYFGTRDNEEVSTRMLIHSNGNVGINTTSPSEKLDIKGNLRVDGDVLLYNEDRRIGTVTNHDMEFITNNTKRLTINANGRVWAENEVISSIGSFYGQARYLRNNTGIIHRNDGVNYYVLISTEDNGTGSWNTLRPFMINNSSGDVSLAQGQIAFEHSTGNAFKPGGGTWSDISDRRLKKDVKPFTDGLNVIMKLEPVVYKYNHKSGYENSKKEYVGFIAQEIEEIIPYMIDIVNDEDGVSGLNDKRIINESSLTKILVNAVKEQQKIIEKQDEKIIMFIAEKQKLAEGLDSVRSENKKLQKQINDIIFKLSQIADNE